MTSHNENFKDNFDGETETQEPFHQFNANGREMSQNESFVEKQTVKRYIELSQRKAK
jgi:hypothetical protein